MVKPLERNTRYVDAVLTVGIRMRCNWVLRDVPLECCELLASPSLQVPKGVLYPMSNMNLAFDREAIGPAMYFGLWCA